MQIDIEVKTDTGLIRLEEILIRLKSFRPAWANVGDILRSVVIRNFQAGGRPKWPPRKQDKDGKYRGLLTRSFQLRNAATNPVAQFYNDHAVWTALVGKKGVAMHYGSNETADVPAHERTITEAFGRKLSHPVTFEVEPHERKMNIPARPFFGVPEGYGEEKRIRKAVMGWVFFGHQWNEDQSLGE